MSSYWESLKDPRWQRKRLEVLERDEWTCQQCGDTKKTLHVHHTYYEKGLKPWEYPEQSLKTLCEKCHEITTALTKDIHRVVGGLDVYSLGVALGFVRGAYAVSDASFSAGLTHISASSRDEWIGIMVSIGLVHGFANRAVRRGLSEGKVSVDWLIDLYIEQTDVLKEHFTSIREFPLPSLDEPYDG